MAATFDELTESVSIFLQRRGKEHWNSAVLWSGILEFVLRKYIGSMFDHLKINDFRLILDRIEINVLFGLCRSRLRLLPYFAFSCFVSCQKPGFSMHTRFLVAAAIIAASLTARADTTTFNFSFGTTADTFSGSGVFTASSLAAGQYTITGVTGTVNTGIGSNKNITELLAAGSFPTLTNGGTTPANDNLLYFPEEAGGYFDYLGVAFKLANGAQVDLYSLPFGYNDAFLLRAGAKSGLNENVVIAVTQASAVTPEPNSILLLGTGLFGVAGLVRRRTFK